MPAPKKARTRRAAARLTLGKADTHKLVQSSEEHPETVSRTVPILLDGKEVAAAFFTATLTVDGDVAVSHGYTTKP